MKTSKNMFTLFFVLNPNNTYTKMFPMFSGIFYTLFYCAVLLTTEENRKIVLKNNTFRHLYHMVYIKLFQLSYVRGIVLSKSLILISLITLNPLMPRGTFMSRRSGVRIFDRNELEVTITPLRPW